jgi:hypothetical protein
MIPPVVPENFVLFVNAGFTIPPNLNHVSRLLLALGPKLLIIGASASSRLSVFIPAD